jgi:hypothetical protein
MTAPRYRADSKWSKCDTLVRVDVGVKVWRTMCECTLVTWMPGVVPSFIVGYSVAVEI